MNCLELRRAVALVSLFVITALALASGCPAAQAGPDPEVLDVDDAAALLRVEPAVVRSLAGASLIPARRVGDQWRFSRAALLEWLKGGPAADASRAVATPPGVGERAASSARGVTREAAPPPAQDTPDPRAAPGSPPATVGERPATPTAEEIALRDQRALLRRGAVTVELSASHSHSEQSLFPVIRQEQRTVGVQAALRVGLLDDLQATLRVPGVWRRTTTFTGATIAGERDRYAGDLSVSLLGVAWREATGRPNVIWSIDAVAPSGPGDRGIGGGLVLSKSYDPAVIFAGLSYLRGSAVDAADSRRSLARHNLGLSMGYTYAVNDSLALSTVFVGTYRNSQSGDGVTIAPPRERYQLQFGLTWLLAQGVFVEPGVAMRLGGESPDLTTSLSFTHSF